MADEIDKILKTMFPEAGTDIKVERLPSPDGTSRNISKETKKSIVIGGKLSRVTVHESALDDFGELIKSIDDVGGYCGECMRLVKKTNYYRCDKCRDCRCHQCIRLVDNRPYCRKCSKRVRWGKFFDRIIGKEG
jgi:hypothetical protein